MWWSYWKFGEVDQKGIIHGRWLWYVWCGVIVMKAMHSILKIVRECYRSQKFLCLNLLYEWSPPFMKLLNFLLLYKWSPPSMAILKSSSFVDLISSCWYHLTSLYRQCSCICLYSRVLAYFMINKIFFTEKKKKRSNEFLIVILS